MEIELSLPRLMMQLGKKNIKCEFLKTSLNTTYSSFQYTPNLETVSFHKMLNNVTLNLPPFMKMFYLYVMEI